MNKLSRCLDEARAEVRVHWTEERSRRVERSLFRRRRRVIMLRSVTGAAMLLGILFVARVIVRWESPAPKNAIVGLPKRDATPRPATELDTRAPLRLRDGSIVRALDVASRVVELPVDSVAGSQRVLALEVKRGGAQFQVVRDPARLFRVYAGRVIAEVLGTEFTMEQLGDHARVAVSRGRVRVSWPGGRSELGAGESGTFPPEPPAEAAPIPPAPSVAAPSGPLAPPIGKVPPVEAVSATAPARPAAPEPKPIADWMGLAQEGHFDSAYEVLNRVGLSTLRGPAQLLLAADVARLSRHPAAAVAPLRRVLSEYARDPRAPLAAFTLGRALLDELGQPREAAAAFHEVEELDSEGPLAADALAREVEAWSRSGDPFRARERALVYLRRYPDGDRQRTVRRYGGLD